MKSLRLPKPVRKLKSLATFYFLWLLGRRGTLGLKTTWLPRFCCTLSVSTSSWVWDRMRTFPGETSPSLLWRWRKWRLQQERFGGNLFWGTSGSLLVTTNSTEVAKCHRLLHDGGQNGDDNFQGYSKDVMQYFQRSLAGSHRSTRWKCEYPNLKVSRATPIWHNSEGSKKLSQVLCDEAIRKTFF